MDEKKQLATNIKLIVQEYLSTLDDRFHDGSDGTAREMADMELSDFVDWLEGKEDK